MRPLQKVVGLEPLQTPTLRRSFGSPSEPLRFASGSSGVLQSPPKTSTSCLGGLFRGYGATLRESPPPQEGFKGTSKTPLASSHPGYSISSAGGDNQGLAPRAPGRLAVREGSTGPRKTPVGGLEGLQIPYSLGLKGHQTYLPLCLNFPQTWRRQTLSATSWSPGHSLQISVYPSSPFASQSVCLTRKMAA